MKRTKHKAVPPDKLLGVLAFQFRGTRDDSARAAIAKAYSLAVAQLVEKGRWREIPSLEDQLPDDWMPEAFFDYWSLSPPRRLAR